MDFQVGLKGFLQHGWHAFLAVSEEEWQALLSEYGFETPEIHKAGDYLVVEARKPRRREPSGSRLKGSEREARALRRASSTR